MPAEPQGVTVVLESASTGTAIFLTGVFTISAAVISQWIFWNLTRQEVRRNKIEEIWHNIRDAQMHFSGARYAFDQNQGNLSPSDDYEHSGYYDYTEGIKKIRDTSLIVDLYFRTLMRHLQPVFDKTEKAVKAMDPQHTLANTEAERVRYCRDYAQILIDQLEEAIGVVRREHRRALEFPLPRWANRIRTRLRRWYLTYHLYRSNGKQRTGE